MSDNQEIIDEENDVKITMLPKVVSAKFNVSIRSDSTDPDGDAVRALESILNMGEQTRVGTVSFDLAAVDNVSE